MEDLIHEEQLPEVHIHTPEVAEPAHLDSVTEPVKDKLDLLLDEVRHLNARVDELHTKVEKVPEPIAPAALPAAEDVAEPVLEAADDGAVELKIEDKEAKASHKDGAKPAQPKTRKRGLRR